MCVCVDGTHLINNKCQACPSGKVFDGTQCANEVIVDAPKCGSNQVFVNNECVCADGFYLINGECLSCPANTKWNGVYCDCQTSNASQWCFGKPYTIYNAGSCNCENNYIMVNGLCTM